MDLKPFFFHLIEKYRLVACFFALRWFYHALSSSVISGIWVL